MSEEYKLHRTLPMAYSGVSENVQNLHLTGDEISAASELWQLSQAAALHDSMVVQAEPEDRVNGPAFDRDAQELVGHDETGG